MKLLGYFGFVWLIAISSGATMVVLPSATRAATSTTLDILPDSVVGTPGDTVEIGNLKPLVRRNPNEGRPAPSGNPLWSVPLSALTATQERPIFSASRRPPARAVAGPRIEPVVAVAAPPAAPERPPLALIGVVVGAGDAIAVFLDRTSQGIVRLRLGDARAGWALSSIQPREVILKKGEQTESLALQRTEGTASPGSIGAPALHTPVSGGTDTSYAPFIPRSTPKNGESDGL